jgi:cell division protein FtsB
MATARRAPAAPRTRQRTAPAARNAPRRARKAPAARIRWDRVGRTALLLVLVVVVGLYVQHALSYLAVRAQAAQQQAVVRHLSKQNAQLAFEQRALNDPATIVRDARALGMVRLGEHPYVITGSSAP